MSGARSPRPRPAGAVMPPPLRTPPSVPSIANQSDPLNVRELPHRQLSPRRSATWMECSWPRPHRPLRRPRQGGGVRSGSAGRLVVSASRLWTASSAPDLHDARRPGSRVIRHRRPALCLVELRGFEPLTPCMPYTDLRPHDGQYSHRAAVPTIRWLPLLTVSDRCLAAPRRPPARPPCAGGRSCPLSATVHRRLMARPPWPPPPIYRPGVDPSSGCRA